MRYTLMHISDLHAGPPFNATIAATIIREAHELRPDLLVVSGDFVQRADIQRQWETIKRFLAELPEPRLYVAGNHDVPLFNPFRRIFDPLTIYQREISADLNPVFERPGIAVVGGCSAHGLTVDGGLVKPDQIAAMQAAFARQPAGTCRIAVLHHHVINPPGCEGRRKIKNTPAVVQALAKSDVDILLCGHIHVSYIGTTLDVQEDLRRGTLICQSGTSTSQRGKGREHGKYSYNVIEIDEQDIRIRQRLAVAGINRFETTAEYVFPRGVRS